MVACAASTAPSATAAEPGPGLAFSIDTTLRYNAAVRHGSRDPNLANAPAIDEGNHLFDRGDLVLSRFDLFAEADLAWRETFGARVSLSAWFDRRFPDRGRSHPDLASRPNYPDNRFTPYVQRYYQGPSAEFADAFVWSNLSIGSTRLNVKAGRLAWLPGEFLFGNGNSASYSMVPNDGMKTDLSPGASAKETALPIGQVLATWQLGPQLTLVGQVTSEFRPSRVSEGGTFFAVADVALEGPPFINNPAAPSAADPRILRAAPYRGRGGDLSFGARWQPPGGQGDTWGVWFRRFEDKNASWQTQVEFSPTAALARAVHARRIQLVGLTYNTLWAGWSLGAELNMRRGMPLDSTGSFATFENPLGLTLDPTLQGARGRTVHALLSGVATLNRNALFDNAVVAWQLDYAHLAKIEQGRERFNGSLSGVEGRCPNAQILRNCATRDAMSVAANFTPTWLQALPSVDVSMPLTALYGLKGVAAPVGTGIVPQRSYLVRAGARVEYHVTEYKHQFELSYTWRGGKTGVLPDTGAPAYSGLAFFRDRNYLSFTYQTGF